MEKYNFIIIPAFFLLIAAGCASTVKITSVAERNKEGDLLLKWEVSPDQEGNINIYSSQSDTDIGNFTPIKTSNITEMKRSIWLKAKQTTASSWMPMIFLFLIRTLSFRN